MKVTLRDSALLESRCYVGGQWIGDQVDAVEDPATGAVLAWTPRFGAAETTAAVDAAATAFPGWATRTARDRAVIVRRWFDLIAQNADDLALILTSEQGKPLAEARGEIAYAAGFFEFFAEQAKRIHGETIPSPWPDSRIFVERQPTGVVAAITPWNFPAAMIARKAAPAIAVGCTIVVKPAPETPLTALALAVLAQRAGVPPGVFNVVTGDARAIGEVLTSHHEVKLVSFTGSTEVGKLLMRQAASTVKKVSLELGGNAPFIVFEDADIDAAVEGAMASKFRNSGQTCICANRIFVQDAVHDDFVEKLARRVAQLKVGSGTEHGTTQGPLISEAAVVKVERHIADAVGRGARVVTGGARHALGRTFFEPTVLTGLDASMLVSSQETFGPVAPIYRFSGETELIQHANATRSGLAAYVYARDVGRIFRVAHALDCGMVGVNSGVISSEVVPFGGTKESGIGREGSHLGVEEYLETKYILLAGL